MPDWETTPLEREALLGDSALGQASRWRLEVLGGPDQGRSSYVDGPLELGSDPSVGFPLTDSTISWHHAKVEPSAQGVRFTDLDSTNGIFVAGVQVDDFVARHDTLFAAGRTLFRVSAERGDEAEALRACFGRALGVSAPMQRLFKSLARAAEGQATVLLMGETGTGKGLLAEALHTVSRRGAGPMIQLDCGTIAPGLIESELFGHAKGAFTGAVDSRQGAFVRAHGGTLFLDEVAELPLEVQPRLLRALDSRTVQPLGGDARSSLDVRIIAATHRDLALEVKQGRFREDLYFRLAVVTVLVPPLRERREDLPLLVRSFLAELGRPDFHLSGTLQDRLERHPWPGNVRELRNVVERALIGIGIDLEPTPRPKGRSVEMGTELSSLPFKEAKDRLVESFSQEYFEALFTRCGRNVSKMARIAGIARPYAHRIVRKYGLKLEPEEG
jgi:DNA-binding NtrC family response regulator